MHSKWYLAVAVMVGLSACKQVINQGPVGGGDVVVTNLRTGAEVYNVPNGTSSRDSIIANEGQEAWDNASDIRRMRKLGRHVFPTDGRFDADTWFVFAISGGRDFDVDRDGVADSDTGTQVQGTLRAIVKGELLNTSFGFAVTPLSESAYRFVADYVDELTDEELQQALDELASDLVGDADSNGSVDYTDVLITNRFFNTDRTLASQESNVSTLANAIATGEAESMLNLLSRNLYSTNAPNVLAEKQYANSISQIVVLDNGCGPGCHYPGGSGSSSNNRLVSTSDPDFVSKNTENFRNLVAILGVEGILSNVRGVAHGGGVRIRDTDPEYDDFEAWLNLL